MLVRSQPCRPLQKCLASARRNIPFSNFPNCFFGIYCLSGPTIFHLPFSQKHSMCDEFELPAISEVRLGLSLAWELSIFAASQCRDRYEATISECWDVVSHPRSTSGYLNFRSLSCFKQAATVDGACATRMRIPSPEPTLSQNSP